MYRHRSNLSVLLLSLALVILTGCVADNPKIRWNVPSAADDWTIEIEFGKGQNGSDLLLTLFKRIASEKDLVITDLSIHFIWDTTRLLECTTPIEQLTRPSEPDDSIVPPHPWIALRVETQRVSEEDYVCHIGTEQIIVPTGGMGEPKLINKLLCSRKPIERVVTRYLHQFYDEWVPPNWAYISTQIDGPVLRERPASCTPINDPGERRLVNRITARVRHGAGAMP